MGAEPLAVVIPALNEATRIAATVNAARRVAGVGIVIVVSDGSRDATCAVARGAGALVVEHRRCRGKAAAMETGADASALLDQYEARAPRHLLFLDADLAGSAAMAAPLAEPVLADRADMTIALLPPS